MCVSVQAGAPNLVSVPSTSGTAHHGPWHHGSISRNADTALSGWPLPAAAQTHSCESQITAQQLQSEDKKALREELRRDEGTDAPNEACECEYEFGPNQERSFSIFMDSLRDTSGATCLMGAASVMAAASNIAAYGLRSTQCVAALLRSVGVVDVMPDAIRDARRERDGDREQRRRVRPAQHAVLNRFSTPCLSSC